ncbi:MAG: tetratricopeptide repeat protein [Hyphomicrobiaceae bacterium]
MFGAAAGATAALAQDEQAAAAAETPAKVEPGPVVSTSLLGSYLAARIAQDERDVDAASELFHQALEREPDNEIILRQAFLAEAQAGNWERASTFASKVVEVESNNRLARVFLGVKAFKEGRFQEADSQFKEAGVGPIGELTATLARAWVMTAEGNGKLGIEALETLKAAEWARYFRIYHRALIADVSGDPATAGAAFKELFDNEPRTLSTALGYASHLAATGDVAGARTIIGRHLAVDPTPHPLAEALQRDLDAGRPVGFEVTSANDGLAEVLYGLGEALASDGGVDIGTIYLQLALYLKPEFPLALAALANVQEQTRQYEQAVRTYDRIPAGSPMAFNAVIRKSLNLNVLDRVDEARAVLVGLLDRPETRVADVATVDTTALRQSLDALPAMRSGSRGDDVRALQDHLKAIGYDVGVSDGAYGPSTSKAVTDLQTAAGIPANGVFGPRTREALAERRIAAEIESRRAPEVSARIQVLTALGNIMRGRQKFDEAVPYYAEAIGLVPHPTKESWSLFYSRGVCLERLKRWKEAEADFLKALELDGDQAALLNYLGYSWVDQGENLDRGLELIRKAVQLKPDDGYFVDSLGWAYYRLKRYEDAARELEKAVELRPDDPVINDHLGDAYWQVGRRVEARYQWAQALTLKPEPEDKARIEAKLKSGLPGEEPKVTDNGGSDASTEQKAE